MDLPKAGKRRLRATGYQNLLFGTFTRGKLRGIIPKVRLRFYPATSNQCPASCLCPNSAFGLIIDVIGLNILRYNKWYHFPNN